MSCPVTLDGERNPAEWSASERNSHVEARFGKGRSEGKYYGRHYVWCMYDEDWLYLAVDTSCADPGTKTVHFPGDEPCDSFPLAIYSDENRSPHLG